MPRQDTLQQENLLTGRILEHLISLQDIYGLELDDIATLIRFKKSTVYKVKKGFQKGSDQMLGALELLLKVKSLEQKEEWESLRKRLQTEEFSAKEKAKLLQNTNLPQPTPRRKRNQ